MTDSITDLKTSLNLINTELENIKNNVSKKNPKDVVNQLDKINKDLDKVLDNRHLDIQAKKQKLSQEMLRVINSTLMTIQSLQSDRKTQEKIGAMQASLFAVFTAHLKEFQSRLLKIKDLKRGEKVAATDFDKQGE